MAGELILIVDDDESWASHLFDVLLLHGYGVVLAATGEEACALVAGGTVPAVVLMDLRMPGRGGIEALATLRRDPRLLPGSLIVVTASLMGHDVASLEALGIDVVRKPTTPRSILARIRTVLDARAGD